MRRTALLLAIGVLAVGNSVSGSGTAPWPTERGNFQRTGLSEFRGPRQGELHWSTVVDAVLPAEPIVRRDGTLLVVRPDELFALSATGGVLWRRPIAGIVASPTVAPDGVVYVAAQESYLNNRIVALNQDGSLRWRVWLGKRATVGAAPVLTADGMLYIVAGKALRAYDRQGHELWRFRGWRFPGQYPGVANRAVTLGNAGEVLVTSGGYVVALDASGHVLWRRDVDAAAYGPALVVSGAGTIYVLSTHARLLALDSDGAVLWRVRVDTRDPPAVGPDGRIYVVSLQGRLRAFSRDGRERWRMRLSRESGRSVSVDSAGVVYVPPVVGEPLTAVRPDGTVAWRWNPSDYPPYDVSSPISVGLDGRLYFTLAGEVYAIGPAASRPLAASRSIAVVDAAVVGRVSARARRQPHLREKEELEWQLDRTG